VQTVARDLTRLDLKLTPPADLAPGPARQQWLQAKPMELEVTQPDGSKKLLTGKDLVRWKYQRYMQDYLACVQGVDDSVGEVLDYLDRTGLAKNTVVIYSSDNGWYLGDLGLYDKRFMYEPSLRVPLLVRGPGVKAGTVTDSFALNIDYAPTFLAAAREKIPADIQGRSLIPILHGAPPADWRTAMYYRYYHDPGHHNTRAHLGIRTTTHKLIHYWKKDAWEMFDLTTDPQEQHNLANDPAQAPKLAELKTQLASLKKEMKDEDQFATTQPKEGVDAQKPFKPLGVKTSNEAISLSVLK
jgi:arylsulfatase A-like enzyme